MPAPRERRRVRDTDPGYAVAALQKGTRRSRSSSGRMKLIAFVANEAEARHILDHLGLDSTGPPLARPKAADDLEPAPDHDVADPVYP